MLASLAEALSPPVLLPHSEKVCLCAGLLWFFAWQGKLASGYRLDGGYACIRPAAVEEAVLLWCSSPGCLLICLLASGVVVSQSSADL